MPPRRRSTAPQRRNTSHQTYVYTISSKAQFQAALERAQVGSSLVRSFARSLDMVDCMVGPHPCPGLAGGRGASGRHNVAS